MPEFSPRQRRIGVVFLVLWTLIYATIPLVSPLNRWLIQADLDRVVWRSLYGVILLGIAAFVWRSRSRHTPGSLLAVGGICAAGLVLAAQFAEPARGLHLAGYGLLGALAHRMLSESFHRGFGGLIALVTVGIIGLGDESLQWLVPGRTYSLGDVGLNGVAALMGIVIAGIWPGPFPNRRNGGLSAAILLCLFVGGMLVPLPLRARTARSWPTMGTWAEVVVEASGETTERRGTADVRAVFTRVDRTLSLYRENSDLRRVNRAAGEGPVTVDPWVARVIRRGRAFERMTGGAFSMNVPGLPVQGGIQSFRLRDRADRTGTPGPIHVYDDPPRVRLGRAHMALDAGGIAKGWALDRAAEALRARGIERYLVRLGRSVMAGGAPRRHPGGWPVNLPGETGPRRIVRQSIAVSRQPADTGIHLLDPRSGRPVPAGRWALVSAREGWVADAASTALAVEPTLTRRLMRAHPSIRWTRIGFSAPTD